jgi:hypothetical protein
MNKQGTMHRTVPVSYCTLKTQSAVESEAGFGFPVRKNPQRASSRRSSPARASLRFSVPFSAISARMGLRMRDSAPLVHGRLLRDVPAPLAAADDTMSLACPRDGTGGSAAARARQLEAAAPSVPAATRGATFVASAARRLVALRCPTYCGTCSAGGGVCGAHAGGRLRPLQAPLLCNQRAPSGTFDCTAQQRHSCGATPKPVN